MRYNVYLKFSVNELKKKLGAETITRGMIVVMWLIWYICKFGKTIFFLIAKKFINYGVSKTHKVQLLQTYIQ